MPAIAQKEKNVRTSQNCPRPRYKRTRDTGYDARATEPQNPRGGRAASRSATADVDLEIDPVASGFAASFARPGGNITGLFFDAPGIVAKWLQALAEILPGMKNAAVLWSPASGQWQLESLKAAARALSITLEVLELRDPAELEALLAAALKKRPQALIQLSSPIISQFQGRVAEFTQQHRLPAISMYTAFPERGGLMSYGPDLPVFFRRAALLVDRILKGTKPADIALEQPTTYELVINLKTAKALGIKIPQAIVLQAIRVIE